MEVRITFRSEVYIKGDNLEEIKEKWDGLNVSSDDIRFVETVSAERTDDGSHKDVLSAIEGYSDDEDDDDEDDDEFSDDFKAALQYVRDNKTWTDEEEQVALNDMDRWRCPLTHTQTGERIADQINDLMEEYGEDNDLPEGWWLDMVGDVEEIFRKL